MKTTKLKNQMIGSSVAVLLCCYSIVADDGGQMTGKTSSMQQSTESRIQSWPDASKKAVKAMIEKYGELNEIAESLIIWHKAGQWKRSIVYRDPVDHHFPVAHKDVLQQFVDMKVPPEKFDKLAMYDGSIMVDRTKGEISAKCDKEAMNFLAINLAKDIISDRKSVEEARNEYAKTAMSFKQGSKMPYTQGFQFQVAHGGTADPDKSAKQELASSGQQDFGTP